MKRIATIIFTIMSLFSLIYYTTQYYLNGELILKEDGIILWTILMTVIIVTLMLGVNNSNKLNKLEKQNEELIKLVKNFSINQDENCDEILETVRNARSVSFDILSKMKRGDK